MAEPWLFLQCRPWDSCACILRCFECTMIVVATPPPREVCNPIGGLSSSMSQVLLVADRYKEECLVGRSTVHQRKARSWPTSSGASYIFVAARQFSSGGRIHGEPQRVIGGCRRNGASTRENHGVFHLAHLEWAPGAQDCTSAPRYRRSIKTLMRAKKSLQVSKRPRFDLGLRQQYRPRAPCLLPVGCMD